MFNLFSCRQAYGGVVAVWNNVTNEQWMFLKEISSDGDVSTVSKVSARINLLVWILRLMSCFLPLPFSFGQLQR